MLLCSNYQSPTSLFLAADKTPDTKAHEEREAFDDDN